MTEREGQRETAKEEEGDTERVLYRQRAGEIERM